jgi:hypothetical protein
MMRTKRLKKLNWPAHLSRDVSVLELADENDRFAEAAELAAARSPADNLIAVVMHHYAETTHQISV